MSKKTSVKRLAPMQQQILVQPHSLVRRDQHAADQEQLQQA
jgi:hypothetical protein